MITLAWDTSGSSQSVALASDQRILSEIFELRTRAHSETLLTVLKKVLEENGIALSSVDRFALTVGPGSFTGLRIGISAVKAFCEVRDRPVAPVSSLAALAESAQVSQAGRQEAWVVPCLDARLQEVFTSTYRVGAGLIQVAAERVLPVEALVEELEALPGKKRIVGSGAIAYRERWQKIAGVEVPEGEREHCIVAAAVVRVAERIFQEGQAVAGREVAARYLRASEAENRLLGLREK